MTISVIIPSYNGKQLLKANLPAVIAACQHWSRNPSKWEVIVVDDASTDASVAWLKKNHPKVKVVVNPQNLRFARAVNRGAIKATGDILILLNNDVKPERNFLRPLLRHFSKAQVFAVGCLEKNLQQGKQIAGGRGVGKFSRGFIVHHRAQDQTQKDTLWVAAGSGAFRKSIWKKLGGLDPLFRPAYEEDRDLSYNALKSGYKILFEPKSKVGHIHETSHLKVFGKPRIKIISFKNQLLFVWKNISSFKLIVSHFFWLPYHLLITTIRSRGLFLLGFFAALSQLFEAIRSHFRVKKLWQLSDEQILANQDQ